MTRDPEKADLPPAPRLLLVDDSEIERRTLAALMRLRHYDVDEAADGRAALHMLKNGAYDLLLLDLQMPGYDGFDLLAYLGQNAPELPVIVLSGLPPDEIGNGIHRLPDHELPPLLIKPIDSEQLAQLVELKLAGELP